MAMRRKDRMLCEADTLQVLKTGEYGVLATVSSDGMPYGVPVSYAYENGSVYIHCAKHDGYKISNIKSSSRVSFTVVSTTELLPHQFATKYMSAIVSGKAELVENEEKKYGLEAILKKYSSEYIGKGMEYIENSMDKVYVIKIIPDEVTGKGRK